MDRSCAPIAVFLYGIRWRQKSAKFRTAFFGQFRTSLRKDSVANYASIWTVFSLFVRGPDVLSNALNILQFRHYVAPQDSLICGGNIRECKNSAAQYCAKYFVYTIYIVINSTLVQQHVRVTISCRYALSFKGRCFCFQFACYSLRVLTLLAGFSKGYPAGSISVGFI